MELLGRSGIRVSPSRSLFRLLTHIKRPIADEFDLDILDIGLFLSGGTLLLGASIVFFNAVLVHDDCLLGRVGRCLVGQFRGALGRDGA